MHDIFLTARNGLWLVLVHKQRIVSASAVDAFCVKFELERNTTKKTSNTLPCWVVYPWQLNISGIIYIKKYTTSAVYPRPVKHRSRRTVVDMQTSLTAPNYGGGTKSFVVIPIYENPSRELRSVEVQRRTMPIPVLKWSVSKNYSAKPPARHTGSSSQFHKPPLHVVLKLLRKTK